MSLRAMLRVRAPLPNVLLLRDRVQYTVDGAAREADLTRGTNGVVEYEADLGEFKSELLNAKPIAEGLVAEYLFYEGSGSTLHDSSGYGNHGAIYGGAVWRQLSNGKWVLEFDGVDDYVKIDKAFDVVEHSVELLIMPSRDTPEKSVILWNFGGDNYWMRVNYNGALFAVYSSCWVEHGYHPSNARFADYAGTWVHIVETWDGESIKLYVNGKIDRTIPNSYVGGHFFDNPDTRIGWAGEPHPHFRGLVALVRIWSRALSDEEVRTLYQLAKLMVSGLP